MELDQYVVARRSRLVEHAVELGAAPDGAAALVDQVLAEQRRAIERAEDPDPVVREAVRAAVLGGRPRRSVLAPLAGTVLVLVLAVAAIRLVGLEPATTPLVPTTYTLDAASATRALTDAGYEVTRRAVELCETADLVVATEPAAGTPALEGSTVTLLVARPPGLSCPAGAGFRSQVWQFLRWVRGFAPPPRLVERPTVVVVDASGTRTTRFDRDELAAAVNDGAALEALRAIVTDVPASDGAFPELTVRNGDPRPPCGAQAPAGYDNFLTIRFDLGLPTSGTDRCPLTGYLIPDGERLASVVLLLPTS